MVLTVIAATFFGSVVRDRSKDRPQAVACFSSDTPTRIRTLCRTSLLASHRCLDVLEQHRQAVVVVHRPLADCSLQAVAEEDLDLRVLA